MVAATFHLDPALVVDEPSKIRMLVRAAAHNVVVSERNRQQDPG